MAVCFDDMAKKVQRLRYVMFVTVRIGLDIHDVSADCYKEEPSSLCYTADFVMASNKIRTTVGQAG